MKRILFSGIVLAACGLLTAPPSVAGTIDASAVISATQAGSDWNYTITLTNTSGAGNDSIATFWFGWVPGQDFMNTTPTNVINPTGWTDNITNGGSSDGFAIQFDSTGAVSNPITSANDLAPGDSLTFGFTSATSPSELMGFSPFHPTQVELTSFVYSVAPFQGDGKEFQVAFASVPEPSSLILGTFGTLGSLAWWRFRRKAGE
jgi:hypothetical protein